VAGDEEVLDVQYSFMGRVATDGDGATSYEFPQGDFFGLGQDSLEANRTDGGLKGQ
jgi:hypothetical protein